MPSIPKSMDVVQTLYESDQVSLPDDFLVKAPHDAKDIVVAPIDFKAISLPEYDGFFGLVLENVLSPSECAQLVRLAEESAKSRGWKPAMVNAGANFEVLAVDYRNSDRIIWDSKEVTERLLKRCFQGQGVSEMLETAAENVHVLGLRAGKIQHWTMTRLNERMRFLRYGPGQFFDRHCDGSYVNDKAAPRMERSLLTFHLYLTDEEGLTGGATSFHAPANDYHVRAKLGRVLVFQHRGLLHSGQEVLGGEKITMRTDLMYMRDD